ncbi:MAG: efflux transporter outer membrane subunit [Maricaulaceae bacterium]
MGIRLRGVAMGASAAVCVSGCAGFFGDHGYHAQSPAAPAQWVAQSEDAPPVPADWIAEFDDPVLDGLIGEALRNNFYLRAAAARIDVAGALARNARTPLLPTLTLNANWQKNNQVFEPNNPLLGGTEVIEVDTTNLNWTGNVSWEADLWGRLRDAARAAEQDFIATHQDFEAARLSLAAQVAQSWYAVVEGPQQVELGASDVATRQRNGDLIERRYSRGLNASLDVRLARNELSTTISTLAQSRQTLGEAVRALEILLGRYPAAEMEVGVTLPELTRPPSAGAPADVLARRPDLRAAEARIEAAGFRVKEARKNLLPQLTLTGNVGPGGNSLDELFDGSRIMSTLAAGLAQPVVAGGAIKSQIRQNIAEAREAVFNYANLALTAYQEAEDALAAERFLLAQQDALEYALEEAVAAQVLAERQFERGLANVFNLLDAQDRKIAAQSALITVAGTRLNNRISLYLAIGGGFVTPATQTADADAEPAQESQA